MRSMQPRWSPVFITLSLSAFGHHTMSLTVAIACTTALPKDIIIRFYRYSIFVLVIGYIHDNDALSPRFGALLS